MKDVYLTKAGIDRLQKELKKLVEVDRKQVIGRIKEARELGDLSENAEYDSATNEQGLIEGRIEEITAMLKNARLIDNTKNTASGKAGIGSKVEVEVEGDKETYTIVGSAEADPAEGFVSSESPLGRALLGHKAGETAAVSLPDGGETAYRILSIV